MATDRPQQQGHEAVLARIENAMASGPWEGRLAVIELIDGLLGDVPSEGMVERLLDVLGRLAQDSKWEVRRAVVPALVNAGRPAARMVIERLTGDDNQWVRQAAERAKRRLGRITTPAEKPDKRARLAFEVIKGLDGTSPQKTYQAAIRIGEAYYEELAGDTAHELNTYRASMEGLLQELEVRIRGTNGATPGVGEIFRKIQDRSRYLRALVSGLIEYSKDAELRFEVHALRPIVTEAFDLAKEKTSACLAGHEVDTIVTISPMIHIEVSRDRLFQALVNVLSNALESIAGKERAGRVMVGVQADGGERLSVTIADTGTGMDAAQVESATKRFRSLKKGKGGIGLGLPLAVKIIEREHSGRLEIESTVGVGTTVTIELPLKRETP
jgi:signal transduction histidine kinase